MAESIEMAHSELRNLVVKAARGAGLSWGMAEEAGWATDWLARRSLPAADWAVSWLVQAVEGKPHPVGIGTRLVDRFASAEGPMQPELLPEDLPAPGFLLPFLHLIAMRRGAMEVTGSTGRAVLVRPDGSVSFGPGWSHAAQGWSVATASGKGVPARAAIPGSTAEYLEMLALRTTVPSSATSRRDAGSAMTDND